VVDFQLTFVFLVVEVKTANTAFVVLSFNLHVWRYSPTVVMSLHCSPSTICQSPSACMIARLLPYAYCIAYFLEKVVGRSEMQMLKKRGARTDTYGAL